MKHDHTVYMMKKLVSQSNSDALSAPFKSKILIFKHAEVLSAAVSVLILRIVVMTIELSFV